MAAAAWTFAHKGPYDFHFEKRFAINRLKGGIILKRFILTAILVVFALSFMMTISHSEAMTGKNAGEVILYNQMEVEKIDGTNFSTSIVIFLAVIFTLFAVGAGLAFFHCDTIDRPIIKSAQRAVETGNAVRPHADTEKGRVRIKTSC